MSFTENQINAINHGQGPALVIAGPGSGKTSVLTHRIKNLIEKHKVDPKTILVITFSKSASTQMQSRFNNLCQNKKYEVEFRTFHSFFFNIIFNEYKLNTSNILNLKQKRELMKEAILSTRTITNPQTELIDILLKEVSLYKNHNESISIESEANLSNELFLKIYNKYVSLCRDIKLIDFEDMMLIVRDLFNKDSDILEKYQKYYRYILIDEYQDINDIQYEIVKKLISINNNIWICGDDDQSIYGFRASNPKIMLNFKNDFPMAKTYNLNVNFRSSDEIINASKLLIKENKDRYYKDIKGTGIKNNGFLLTSFASEPEENLYLIELIKNNIKNKTSTAVLFRTNLEASIFASVLSSYKIDFAMKENFTNPFKNVAVSTIIHYLNLSSEYPKVSYSNLIAIINKPMRYIKRELINGNISNFERLYEIFYGNNMAIIGIRSLEYNLQRLAKLPDIYSKINYIRKAIGIDDYYRISLANLNSYDNYCKNMDQIMNISRALKTVDDLNREAEIFEDLNQRKKSDKIKNEFVEIMTFHASKGLEFESVILPHINEGHVPHKKSSNSNLEEERRLLYVAMTRAKRYLYITYVSGGRDKEYMPSRFLYPLIKNNGAKSSITN